MITSPAFAGRRYAVLGLARSGLATVAALLAGGAEVTAWDSDEAKRKRNPPRNGEGDQRGSSWWRGADASAPSAATPSTAFGG